jgi:hypothetical protein
MSDDENGSKAASGEPPRRPITRRTFGQAIGAAAAGTSLQAVLGGRAPASDSRRTRSLCRRMAVRNSST